MQIALCLFLSFIVGCTTEQKTDFEYKIEPSSEAARNVLVGANYYAGWWPNTPEILNKWHDFADGHNWLEDYPERTPLLGVDNNQETMDKEIIAASEHGLDFFLILWYPWHKDLKTNPLQSPKLNDGLTYFMNSPEAHRMKFYVEVCNHPPFVMDEFSFWKECVEVWIEAMKHPSHLKVGDKPVIKIHSIGHLLKDCGGKIETVEQWIEYLRQEARDAGLGELLICGGGIGPMVWENHWAKDVFDFTGDYMDLPKGMPKDMKMPYDYSWLANFLIQLRSGHKFDEIPYMPVLGSSWDPTPWDYPLERGTFKFPTRNEWKTELERMATDLENMPQMGIPLPDGSLQKAFTIYAWNEFGEGSFIAPAKGDSYMKLECIREVFGVKKHGTGNANTTKND